MEMHSMVSLGFTEEKVPAGTHMCLVFNNEQERIQSLLKYLLLGLQTKERVACFSNNITEKELRDYFSENGISYDERLSNKALMLSGTSEVYFVDGVFDPDRMLHTLMQYHKDSKAMGFPASRVIGEMMSEVEHTPGGERLLEYESRVTILLREHPITTICQYDANTFSGATIMEVLKVHPKIIVNGVVINNPFFVEPEEYLAQKKDP